MHPSFFCLRQNRQIASWVMGCCTFLMVSAARGQGAVLGVIQAGIKKAIVALDLKVQKLQTQTIWLQNSQKVLENEMTRTQLADIAYWTAQEKDLLAGYYQQLETVSPLIRSSPPVLSIFQKQAQIASDCANDLQQCRINPAFTAPQRQAMVEIYTRILQQSKDLLVQTQALLTDSQLQMSDGERLLQLQQLADQTRLEKAHLRLFSRQATWFTHQRGWQQQDARLTSSLYSLQEP
ncbi:MAG: hypothetical protein ACYCOO_05675 [Chitinophagaceae bacterium]